MLLALVERFVGPGRTRSLSREHLLRVEDLGRKVYWPRTRFTTRAAAEHALTRYIHGWYNPRRIEAGLDGLSPDEYEDAHHRKHPTPDG